MKGIDGTSFHSQSSASQCLRAYLRLLSGRSADAADLNPPSYLPPWFAVAGLALWLAVDYWLALPEPSFFLEAVLAWTWYAALLLATVLWASQLARPRIGYERLLRLLLMLVPVLIVLVIAMLLWVPQDWQFVAALAIALYVSRYIAAALRSLTLHRQPRATVAVFATLLAGVYLSDVMYVSARFWYVADAESDDASPDYWSQQREAEALLFAQPAKIDAAIATFERPAELPAAAFFIGFAGYGEQRVFASEIALAEQVIGQRFDITHRSLRLVNDRRDLESQPLASPSALRYALQAVAKRMDLDRDVLFLSLSSHGSEHSALEVRNGVLPLNDLTVADLAAALREAGIRWKVVIVSACYAGQFIEPLRDANTIVIAAAAADRTSFGCADDRELTYFGEAFYRDAFPATGDLRSAFDLAAAAIAAREQAEGRRPSKPQAHFGEALVAHLQAAFPPRG